MGATWGFRAALAATRGQCCCCKLQCTHHAAHQGRSCLLVITRAQLACSSTSCKLTIEHHHLCTASPSTSAAATYSSPLSSAARCFLARQGDVELYLRYWQAPGRAVSSYDLRSYPGDFRRVGASTADLASSIRLDSDHHAYRPGEGKGNSLRLKASEPSGLCLRHVRKARAQGP